MTNDYLDMVKQIKEQLDLQQKKFGNVQGLMRNFNEENLKIMHHKLEGNKATGIDKVTKKQYEDNLDENINNLVTNMKSRKYNPLPVRRVEIPKPNGKKRPLGIPSHEDKVVQAMAAVILNITLDKYFKDFSYGFRPGRDCHQAIEKVDEIIMFHKTNVIVEADIKGFFDHVDHELLIRMLKVIIKDKDFIWLIKKFLKAGYMQNNEFHESEEGTPQGGLISPILANLYLHVVLDNWFVNEVKPLCKGEANMVRYADDFVCMFQNEKDAKMFYEMLIKRFAQFKLEVEPTKTKIFTFGRYSKENNTFDFLGFTISNCKTRKGKYRIDFSTSSKKSKLKMKNIKEFAYGNIHLGYKELIKQLNLKLIGIYNYYGISGNYDWLKKLYKYVVDILRKCLSKRSQKGKLSWDKMHRIMEYCPLVKPKITYALW